MVLEQIYNRALIFITNNREWLSKLDSRLKSRLMLESLDFRSYNQQEVEGILKQRIEYAFVNNVFSKEALNEISNFIFRLNDIRTGLFLLRESGNIAESGSSKIISLEHTNKAIEKIKDFKNELDLSEKVDNLGEEEKILFELIKENDGKNSKELYEMYVKKSGNNIKYRRFKDGKLNYLKNSGFIDIEEVSLGVQGRKTIVRLNKEKKLNEF